MDEWYNFKAHPRKTSDGLNMLLAVDEKSYDGGVHGDDHPIAWCHTFDGGRCFYTSLGHFDEAYEDERFMGQLLGGIFWTAGLVEQ
jgi:type 1 glutamine amidotransferase